MKILTNTQYKDLLNKIEHLEHSVRNETEMRLKAENLKDVLVELASKTGIPKPELGKYLSWDIGEGVSWGSSMALPDNVLQYTEDILGGKVIKQDGVKCLVIGKDGNVTTGLTKQKADKGYSYKLIRK